MRKMVSIRIIEDLQPIPDADRIEKARIGGWWCVVKKGEFQVGSKCLYHEIDSFVPQGPRYDFLSKGTSLKKMLIGGEIKNGYRLKTVVLRNQVSQGLALPVPEELVNVPVGTDVSEELTVYKYEMPEPSAGIKGDMPGFIPKTDEERIQNLPDVLVNHRGKRFYVTEKLDGTSCSIYKYRGEFGVCGRNREMIRDSENMFWKVAIEKNLEERLPDGYVIQGELVGPDIEGNRLRLTGRDLYIFYVFKIDTYEYLSFEEMLLFVCDLGLKMVPIVEPVLILDHEMDQIVGMANGPSILNPEAHREGIVFRLEGPGMKVSFKSISNPYLIEHDA